MMPGALLTCEAVPLRCERWSGSNEPTVKLNIVSFVVIAMLLWLPVMILLALTINVLAWMKVGVPAATKHVELTDACSFFGIAYCVISVPAIFLLWRVRPSSRLGSFAVALPFSFVIPFLAMLILLPTFYWGLYAVVFAIMTWNAAPILWSIAVAELRWRAIEIERRTNTS